MLKDDLNKIANSLFSINIKKIDESHCYKGCEALTMELYEFYKRTSKVSDLNLLNTDILYILNRLNYLIDKRYKYLNDIKLSNNPFESAINYLVMAISRLESKKQRIDNANIETAINEVINEKFSKKSNINNSLKEKALKILKEIYLKKLVKKPKKCYLLY